jgi:hypothetical protein
MGKRGWSVASAARASGPGRRVACSTVAVAPSLPPRPRRCGPSARACSLTHSILSSSRLHGHLLLIASPSPSPFLSSAAVVGCAANTVLRGHIRLARLVPHRGRLDGLGLVKALFSPSAFPTPPAARPGPAAKPAPTQSLPSVPTGTRTPSSHAATPRWGRNTSVASAAQSIASTSASSASFVFLDSDAQARRVPFPDVSTILARTPRPRRSSSTAALRGTTGADLEALAPRRRVNEGVVAAQLAYEDDNDDQGVAALN